MAAEYISRSPEETYSLGAVLGNYLKGGEIILLSGDLGAGKTLLTKGIVSSIGIDDPGIVVSPSFTLINIYSARLDIIHIDLYRLDSNGIYELGLEDYMDKEHIIIVEWADKAKDYFTGDILEIMIEYAGDNTRKISLESKVSWLNTMIKDVLT